MAAPVTDQEFTSSYSTIGGRRVAERPVSELNVYLPGYWSILNAVPFPDFGRGGLRTDAAHRTSCGVVFGGRSFFEKNIQPRTSKRNRPFE